MKGVKDDLNNFDLGDWQNEGAQLLRWGRHLNGRRKFREKIRILVLDLSLTCLLDIQVEIGS